MKKAKIGELSRNKETKSTGSFVFKKFSEKITKLKKDCEIKSHTISINNPSHKEINDSTHNPPQIKNKEIVSFTKEKSFNLSEAVNQTFDNTLIYGNINFSENHKKIIVYSKIHRKNMSKLNDDTQIHNKAKINTMVESKDKVGGVNIRELHFSNGIDLRKQKEIQNILIKGRNSNSNKIKSFRTHQNQFLSKEYKERKYKQKNQMGMKKIILVGI